MQRFIFPEVKKKNGRGVPSPAGSKLVIDKADAFAIGNQIHSQQQQNDQRIVSHPQGKRA
jgi:hypothetical protein